MSIEQFFLIPYSQFINHKIQFQENKNWNKSKKKRSLYKKFDHNYSAVNARLKTSKNKHLFDLVLNSPKFKLSQSDKIILDNRDTKEPYVCTKAKKLLFWISYFFILEATQLPPKFIINKKPKQKTEELGSLSKCDKVSLNRLCSRSKAACGSFQNLSKASGLSKKKVEK